MPEIYAAAFRVFSLLLPKFSKCFCPNFPLVLPEFPIAFSRNSGKSNWELGLLRSDWKFERTCIFCPNFLCPKSPIYLKIVYIYRFGRNRYEQIRACYCEQVYDSYRREASYIYITLPPLIPKLHCRKFNLFYISTFFFGMKLLRKNSQMLQISFSIPTLQS